MIIPVFRFGLAGKSSDFLRIFPNRFHFFLSSWKKNSLLHSKQTQNKAIAKKDNYDYKDNIHKHLHLSTTIFI